MEVHRQLGPGFLELVYREALQIEFGEREISYRSEVRLPVRYKGKLLISSFRADLVCFEHVIVELKALGCLTGLEVAQVLNYLKASEIPCGLLINFGARSLQYKRLIYTPPASLHP